MASCDPGVGYKGYISLRGRREEGQGFESAVVSVWRVLFGLGRVGTRRSVASR
jgi:hypothetical protein